MDMQQPLLRDSDTQLHAVPVRSGMAVWQEDLSRLNRLRREIQDVQDTPGGGQQPCCGRKARSKSAC